MPGIYLMAVITIGLTAMLCIAYINHLTRSDRRYLWLLLPGLLSSFVVNRWVKTPVVTSIAASTNIPLKLDLDAPQWFILLILLNAPIFEEAIKMLPAAIPTVRKLMNDASGALWAGLALGMSFGLGEAAFIAYGLAQSIEYKSLPWYVFTGFLVERMIVTFGHGFMTAIAAYGFYRGGRHAIMGYLSAVGLHALINLGPILLALQLKPEAVFSAMSYTFILVAFFIFQKIERTAKKKEGVETEEIVYFER